MTQLYSFITGSALLLVAITSNAQTKIKDGSVTGTSSLAKPGAILDLESSKRALLLPRVELTSTTSWAPLNGSVPTEGGYTVYNTSSTTTEGSAAYPVLSGGVGEYYWDGGGWIAKKYSAASVYQEPFQIEGTTTKATTNTQNIYQNGNLGLGDFSATNPIAKLDVRGAVRIGGNAFTTDNGYYSYPATPHTGIVGINSVAMGYANEASGIASFASGSNSIASGNYSAAIGYGNDVSGVASIAMGSFSIASGKMGSIAIGDHATASGQFSTAIGYSTMATEYESTAIGHQAAATKDGATAIGLNASASGNTSTAIGNQTEATGALSTAIGSYSDAIGENSIAMGNNVVSNGDFSVAMGTDTKAFGKFSTAMGYRTNASSANETVIGFENAITTGNATTLDPTDALVQVGNGFTSTTPSNAVTILKNGKTKIGGSHTTKPDLTLEISGTDGLLLPTGTDVERPVSAVFGTLRYNTTIGRAEVYVNDLNGDGTQGDAGWRPI